MSRVSNNFHKNDKNINILTVFWQRNSLLKWEESYQNSEEMKNCDKNKPLMMTNNLRAKMRSQLLKISKNFSYEFKNFFFWIFKKIKWDIFRWFSTTKNYFWESPNLFVKLNYSCFKLLLQYWLLWVLHKLSMVCEIVIVIYFILLHSKAALVGK